MGKHLKELIIETEQQGRKQDEFDHKNCIQEESHLIL